MPRKKAAEEDTFEFLRIFPNLNPNNRQYTLAILHSLQFAEEQERERRAKEEKLLQKQSGKKSEGGDVSC